MSHRANIENQLADIIADTVGRGNAPPTRQLLDAGIPARYANSIRVAAWHVDTPAAAKQLAAEYADIIAEDLDRPMRDRVAEIVDSIPSSAY